MLRGVIEIFSPYCQFSENNIRFIFIIFFDTDWKFWQRMFILFCILYILFLEFKVSCWSDRANIFQMPNNITFWLVMCYTVFLIVCSLLDIPPLKEMFITLDSNIVVCCRNYNWAISPKDDFIFSCFRFSAQYLNRIFCLVF